MKKTIDSAITEDFLLNHFKSPNQFRECYPISSETIPNPIPDSTQEISKERFIRYMQDLKKITQGNDGMTQRNIQAALKLYFDKYYPH